MSKLFVTQRSWTPSRSLRPDPENEGDVSYQRFTDAAALQRLVENDLAVLLSERFTLTQPQGGETPGMRCRRRGRCRCRRPRRWAARRKVATVEALVGRESVRLVTLTGPGGSGKSRLAVEAPGRLQPAFADGMRFIELASVRSADLVPGAIAGRANPGGPGSRPAGGR